MSTMKNNVDSDLLSKFELAFNQENWNELSTLLDPKLFRIELNKEKLVGFKILAKVAEILTTEESVPGNIKVSCLKCLGNSCFNGYKHKQYTLGTIDKCCHKVYASLSRNNDSEEAGSHNVYQNNTYFPYEGVVEWACNYLITYSSMNRSIINEEHEIARLSVQFLCNCFTFACKDVNSLDKSNILQCLTDTSLKGTIINLTHSEQIPLIRASCAFIHNALKELPENYFTELEKITLCSQLMSPIRKGFESAKDSLLFLLRSSDVLRHAYENISMEDKLYLLELIYSDVSKSVYQTGDEDILVFSKDTIEFLSERFKKRSDLILKTVKTYLNDMEPTEIIILLDILGTLTSQSSEANFLKNDKSLLINCIYLLRSVQAVGKESDNYFSPVQKLSEVAPAAHGITTQCQQSDSISENGESQDKECIEKIKNDPQSHPAFGFKAGLIKVIGNMCYRNRVCQDLLRETDAIALLLDCCNIDARNPLIMQWSILAVRNLCEGNSENQEVIRNSTRVGVVESGLLMEMGLTLHEQGETKIGIAPLIRKK